MIDTCGNEHPDPAAYCSCCRVNTCGEHEWDCPYFLLTMNGYRSQKDIIQINLRFFQNKKRR